MGTGAIYNNGVKVSYTKAPKEIMMALTEAGEEFTEVSMEKHLIIFFLNNNLQNHNTFYSMLPGSWHF